jgi:hypothetical protein
MSIDTNVSHYTIAELLAIIEVDDLSQTEQIIRQTEAYGKKYGKNQPELGLFFQDIKQRLLQEEEEEEETREEETREKETREEETREKETREKETREKETREKEVQDRFTNEYLSQHDQTELNKITKRKNKVRLYEDPHIPMTREQLGVSDNFTVPVKQDSLNPNLKNTITRFVNIDSQFRQYSDSLSLSTNYTLDLSDRLMNTLSLNLFSYQIPNTWYVLDPAYNNTCFWFQHENTTIPITIPAGNYTPAQFVSTLNNVFVSAGFVFPGTVDPISYNINNGKLTFQLYGGTFTDPLNSFTIDTTTKVIFFDFTASLVCNQNCINNTHYFNQSLGWLMGFRVPDIAVEQGGNMGTAVVDLNGTKYLILVIDDYNQNRVNNGLVTITELSGSLKMPSYYSPDMPFTCLPEGNSNLSSLTTNTNTNTDGLLIAGKYNNDYTKTQIVLPSAPRTLTQSQLYTINEIQKNNHNLTNYRAKAPTTADVMAVIPLKGISDSTGTLLVDFSGSLQDIERTYFGPVNIDKLAVKLLDDKGNVLNLNGADWCITLQATCLYQY